MEMSNEDKVLGFLEYNKHEFVSPTKIAQLLMSPRHHSAWASPICKRLVAKGKAERNDKGHYKYKEPNHE